MHTWFVKKHSWLPLASPACRTRTSQTSTGTHQRASGRAKCTTGACATARRPSGSSSATLPTSRRAPTPWPPSRPRSTPPSPKNCTPWRRSCRTRAACRSDPRTRPMPNRTRPTMARSTGVPRRASQRTSVRNASCAWPPSQSRAGLCSIGAALQTSTRARRARAWPRTTASTASSTAAGPRSAKVEQTIARTARPR